MTENQIEIADNLLKRLMESSGYLDKDQLWFFFLKDKEDDGNATAELFLIISLLEEKNFLYWMTGRHKIQVKNAGIKASEIGIRQYEKIEADKEKDKYLKFENSNINYGVNNGNQRVNQDLSRRRSQTVNKPPKTETKIIRDISIGLIVTVIGGLILYYLLK